MRFNKRLLGLELRNRSAIGLDRLNDLDLRRFRFFVEKSDGLRDMELLTLAELEEVNYFFQICQPLSKVHKINLANLTDYQLEMKLKQLQAGDTGSPDFKGEIEKEFMRRSPGLKK